VAGWNFDPYEVLWLYHDLELSDREVRRSRVASRTSDAATALPMPSAMPI